MLLRPTTFLSNMANVGANLGADGPSFRIVTWNVRGMGGPIKRSRVFSHLKSLNADLCFIQ